MSRAFIALLFCGFSSIASLHAQTIAEKKAGSIASAGGELPRDMQKFLLQANSEMRDSQEELQKLYAQAQELYKNKAPEAAYKDLLVKINQVKENIRAIEGTWREMAVTTRKEEGYALWHEPDTTLGQLVDDYGSDSYIYISTPEISSMKLSVDSNLPIPRASWGEVLELILNQNGVGIRQLNPYLRELYLTGSDRSNIKLITNKRQDLEIFPSSARVAFVLSPEPSESRRIWNFLEKFVNPNTTGLQLIGRDILIVGTVGEVQDTLKVYDFVTSHRGEKEYRTIRLRNIPAEEMARILGAIFDQSVEIPKGAQASRTPERPGEPMPPRPQPPRPEARQQRAREFAQAADTSGTNGLKIIVLANAGQSLFLVGTKEEIHKAEEIVQEVEKQIGEAREKTIFWYTTKHADPEQLAQILESVYNLMVRTGTGREVQPQLTPMEQRLVAEELKKAEEIPTSPPPRTFQPELLPVAQAGLTDEGYFLTNRYIVNSEAAEKPIKKREFNKGRTNFIVDPTTGAIVMVVEQDLLHKIKDLIKKLDVPTRMVEIEVMLFEKIITRENDMGLNLLQLGTLASQTNATSFLYNSATVMTNFLPVQLGITNFLISRTEKHGVPAFDAAFRFLLSRDDVTINAAPSVIAVNQTPAVIKIEDEISVNTGIFIIQDAGIPTTKNSFARARYGINIEVTPTIHMREDMNYLDDTPNYVTLDTNILFENFKQNAQSQPDVTRRAVKNLVNIPDGQTVVIGGLRRKDTDDNKAAIPFLGEIPGFGKLFSTTLLAEKSTDMFIFMTPKIVTDYVDDLERLRAEEMCQRPGDVPDFMCELVAAREWEKSLLMTETMTMLFGWAPNRCTHSEKSICKEAAVPEMEYDGR